MVMIKNYRALVIIAYILCVSISLVSMDIPKNTILTVALFDPDRAVLGTNKDCSLFKKATQDKEHQIRLPLHTQLTYNVIPNKKKLQIGVLSKNIFTVYDINTLNKIWSKTVQSENYSVAFSPVDNTIFFYQNQLLSSNTGIGIILPCIRNNTHIGIECHPKKKEILYPYSNRGLAVYSFANKTRTMYYPKVRKTDTILRALYSPEGNHIAVLTDTHKIFIYNPTTNATISIPEDGCSCAYFGHPIFIPNSTAIAFSCDYCKKIHCWDFKKKQLLVKLRDDCDVSIKRNNPFINLFDFSDDGTYYLCTGSNNIAKIGNTGSKIINHIQDYIKDQKSFLCYCSLKVYANNHQNVLPLDIIRLLIQQLRALYGMIEKTSQ